MTLRSNPAKRALDRATPGALISDGVGLWLLRRTRRSSDVSLLPRVEAVGEVEGYWPGAPDLAVEVISPADRHVEVEEKVFDWLEAGTRMVLTINPRKRSVTVYRSLANITVLTEKDVVDGGEVVPSFRLAVRELFA